MDHQQLLDFIARIFGEAKFMENHGVEVTFTELHERVRQTYLDNGIEASRRWCIGFGTGMSDAQEYAELGTRSLEG